MSYYADRNWEDFNDEEAPRVLLRCEVCGDEFDSGMIDCPSCGSAHTSYASDDARRMNDFNTRRR